MKYENFEQLKEDCSNCKNCPLGETRTNLVFGVGNENADIIDVYEALDMFLPGLFAYRSILNDGKKMKIEVTAMPKREEAEAGINEQLIVEYYSR